MTVLNSLQTSAEVLEVKRGDQAVDLTLAEQHRRDEHYHREPRAKLKHTKDFLECSGICTVRTMYPTKFVQ